MKRILMTATLLALAVPASGSADEPITGQFEATPCHVTCFAVEDACAVPRTQGGSDDVTVTATGSLLTVEIGPEVDWDSVICSTSGEQLAIGANLIGDECDNAIGPQNYVPIGCDEVIQLQVEPGARYIVRAYNIADPFPTPYTISGAEA